ncbi:hypothetical protein SCA6_001288 [Theobroma cacao]
MVSCLLRLGFQIEVYIGMLGHVWHFVGSFQHLPIALQPSHLGGSGRTFPVHDRLGRQIAAHCRIKLQYRLFSSPLDHRFRKVSDSRLCLILVLVMGAG